MGTKGALTLSTMFNITERSETNTVMLTLLNQVVLHRHSSYYSPYFSIGISHIKNENIHRIKKKVESLLLLPD